MPNVEYVKLWVVARRSSGLRKKDPVGFMFVFRLHLLQFREQNRVSWLQVTDTQFEE